MKERPILFSAPMVRAILAGTKTQTRRVIKPQPEYIPDWSCPGVGGLCFKTRTGRPRITIAETLLEDEQSPELLSMCPYGVPGDRLWVKETWRCFGGREYEYQREPGAILYRATDFGEAGDGDGWRPSIFMPRWASRITLEVTSVRVERLQAITPAAAEAEGIGFEDTRCDGECGATPCALAVPRFADLWREINGAESWDANPYVWVVEFRRVEAQERAA